MCYIVAAGNDDTIHSHNATCEELIDINIIGNSKHKLLNKELLQYAIVPHFMHESGEEQKIM